MNRNKKPSNKAKKYFILLMHGPCLSVPLIAATEVRPAGHRC